MAYDHRGLFDLIVGCLNSSPNVSMIELSQQLGIGRHTIEKCVKSLTGMTFRKLQRTILLEHARHLLAHHPNLSIKEISFDLGYASQRSFSRFIRASAGCSPNQLRARTTASLIQSRVFCT